MDVKTQLGNNVKRFELPSSCTFADLMKTMTDLYKEDKITTVKYKDEDEEFISMNSEEEFTEALKTIPKTNNTLKIFLNNTLENASTTKKKDLNKESSSHLHRQDSKSKTKQSKCESDDSTRRSSVPHKIKSASQLSKDIELVSSEVTGRIPVASSALKCGLDTHFNSQQPGCRKIRPLSLSSQSCEKRCEPRKRKLKHRSCSAQSSESSSSSSSSNSSWSSSSESCSDNEEARPRRPGSPTNALNKLLTKFEKRIHEKMTEDLNSCVKEIKKDISSSVTNTVLQQLNGAVIESIKTTNLPQANSCKSDSNRVRYHHQNVICDNCDNEIFGPRYKCGNCSDYDLCEKCENIEGIHTPSHVFLKLHYPSVHAGRKSTGGRPSPLLASNIYEERETEREREDLLQRKFDSGSELDSKTLEKIEKQRVKMKEAKRKKEAHELRKDEWKKVRKELRKNKREISRKLKLAKMQQQCTSLELQGVQELTLSPAEREFCYIHRTNDTVSLQDHNVMTALSGLQIVQTSQENVKPEFLSTADDNDEIVAETAFDDLVQPAEQSQYKEDDGDKKLLPGDLVETAIGTFETIQQQLELMDLRNEASSVTSEDFIVVSKVFDLDTPLDRKEIRRHLKRGEDDEDVDGTEDDTEDEELEDLEVDQDEEDVQEDKDQEKDEDSDDEQNEYVDSDNEEDDEEGSEDETDYNDYYESSTSLVTTDQNDVERSPLKMNVRNQPGISPASKESTSLMDEDIEDISGSLSQPDLTPTPTNETSPPVFPVIETQPQNLPRSLEEPIAPIVVKQPESHASDELARAQVISTQPTLHDEIMTLKESVDNKMEEENGSQPKTLLEQAAAAQVKADETKNTEELILEMQKRRENSWLEQYSKQEQCSVDLLKSVAEAAGSNDALPLETTKDDTVANLNRNSSFGEVITDAMASVVDAAASVAATLMQPASSPPPKASYCKEEEDVSVITAERQRQSSFEACMGQLFDMGFFDRDLNAKLLRKHNNDVTQCVNELVHIVDNHWHQARH